MELTRAPILEKENGRERFQYLGQQHGQSVEAEKLHADDLDPDRDGRLIERDKVGGIERVEE